MDVSKRTLILVWVFVSLSYAIAFGAVAYTHFM